MPILDDSEINRMLDDAFGATHGPNAPDEHELILLTGDPRVDGVELDPGLCPGYAPVPIPNDGDWPAADAGEKDYGLVTFATPTGDWQQAGRYLALRAVDTGGIGFFGALSKPVSPAEGGTVRVALIVRNRSINNPS